jgi:uncharacterized protein
VKRAPVLELYPDADGKTRWRLTAPNGNIVADSGQGYASRRGALRAAARLPAILFGARLVNDGQRSA